MPSIHRNAKLKKSLREMPRILRNVLKGCFVRVNVGARAKRRCDRKPV